MSEDPTGAERYLAGRLHDPEYRKAYETEQKSLQRGGFPLYDSEGSYLERE